jgi:hypothetical protein
MIVDDYAAGVVRRIFAMRSQGMGYPTITKTLNAEEILPPLIYFLEKTGRDSSHIKTRQWIITTIASILKREIYIGTAEQLVKTVVSYRNSKEVLRPKDERVRVENAFPAVIDRETWDAVQGVNRRASKSCSNRTATDKSIFSGLLVCADCGVSMNFRKFSKNYASGKRISYTNAQCRTFQSTGGASCSAHTISGRVLHKLVVNHIRKMAEQITLDEDAVRESLKRRLTAGTSGSKAGIKKEIKALGQDVHRLEVLTAKLYEDWADGVISEEIFTVLLRKNEDECEKKQQRLVSLEQSSRETSAKEADIECWMRFVREYAAVDNADRELVEGLIEKIEVSEEHSENGQKQQDIKIYYKFVGLC